MTQTAEQRILSENLLIEQKVEEALTNLAYEHAENSQLYCLTVTQRSILLLKHLRANGLELVVVKR